MYSTGRSCIREILKYLKASEKKIAIVPPFTCESVTDPFFENGYEVYTYPIKKNLCLDLTSLKDLLFEKKPSVFIYHEYFGFRTCEGLREMIGGIAVWDMKVINDQTQSMFTGSFRDFWSDYAIGSIRKWGPIPDGAYLLSREDGFPEISTEDTRFVENELIALDLKQRYQDGEDILKDAFLKRFAEGREYADIQMVTYGMSGKSRFIVNNIDWREGALKRNRNYKYLLDGLSKLEWISIPIDTIEEDDVPYLFPLYISNAERKKLQSYLATNRVYATIIWGCPKELESLIRNVEKKIYDEILCLSCDQRYEENDMKRIVELFNSYSSSLGNLVKK